MLCWTNKSSICVPIPQHIDTLGYNPWSITKFHQKKLFLKSTMIHQSATYTKSCHFVTLKVVHYNLQAPAPSSSPWISYNHDQSRKNILFLIKIIVKCAIENGL